MLSFRFVKSGETSAFLVTTSKNFNIGVHSEVCKPIWSNLVTDTVELWILLLKVKLFGLDLHQGYRDARTFKLLRQLSNKVFN